MARLLTTKNLVLVHPITEDGMIFLPCCYGYATTVRRAQGMSLPLGCIYFDQRKHAAGRGYAYVAVSRFQSRAGCHLFGKLRVSDFLPVGEDKEGEVLERGIFSESGSESECGDMSTVGCGMDAYFERVGALEAAGSIGDDIDLEGI